MTDLAKAVEIAKRWLTNSVDENFRYFDFNDAAVLAKAFLALREKVKRYEKVVEAARSAYGFLDEIPSSLEKVAKRNLLKALEELEPGEADEV